MDEQPKGNEPNVDKEPNTPSPDTVITPTNKVDEAKADETAESDTTSSAVSTDTSSDTASETDAAPKPKKSKKKLLLIVCLVVVLLAGAGVGAFLYMKSKDKPVVQSTDTPSQLEESQTETVLTPSDFTPKKLANGNTQVDTRIWFKTPVEKPLNDYKLMSDDQLFYKSGGSNGTETLEPNFSVFHVGETEDGKELLMYFSNTIDSSTILFTAKEGNFVINKAHSPTLSGAGSIIPEQTAKTSVDTTTSFPELILPEALDIKKVGMEKTGGENRLFDVKTEKNISKHDENIYGEVYLESFTPVGEEVEFIKTERYSVVLYNFTSVQYQPKPKLGDLKKGSISFSDGTKSASDYSNGFQGCSLGGTFLDVISETLEYTPVGTTSSGTELFVINTTAKNTQLVDSLLKGYNSFFTDAPLTKEQLIAKRPYVVYKNIAGVHTILYNLDVIPAPGCGKPVIYLYPTAPTDVSVQVEADVHISEPAYNGGWNVFAYPSGTLQTPSGALYRNLYWEGYSDYYPEVRDGFIVAQKDIAPTMRKHLAQLGLNETESADFMQFWMTKMPSTPFVRFTWFGTNEVNKIAPLIVSPKPDTTIRIFLDFEGLQEPVALPEQKLRAVERKGFTLVEWGGLLQEPLR